MMLGVLSLSTVALASAPEVTQLDNHKVRGTVEVAAPVERVRTLLSDPRNVANIDKSGTTVTIRGTEANCQLVHSAVAHPIASIEYETRVCPVADGWKATLVKSDDLVEFESVWKVEEKGDRTRILYEIRTIPDIPVPQFVVDRQTRTSVQAMLVKLRKHLETAN